MCFQETLAQEGNTQHTTIIRHNKQEVTGMFSLVIALLAQPVFGPVEQVYFNGDSLDSGFGSAPCLVDWNGDGLTDILMGTRMPYSPFVPYALGGVYYMPNSGTPEAPQFKTITILEADGEPISQGT